MRQARKIVFSGHYIRKPFIQKNSTHKFAYQDWHGRPLISAAGSSKRRALKDLKQSHRQLGEASLCQYLPNMQEQQPITNVLVMQEKQF